jgi:uncharacterized protein (TIGR02246 family)
MNTDERAIRNLVDAWHEATRNGDVERVLTLMAEDAMFLVAGRPPIKGRHAFEQGLRKVLGFARIESSGEIEELQVGGDFAYALTMLSVRMTPLSGGEPTERSGHTVTIFRKQANGSWLLYRDANLLPPPK